MTPLTRSLFRTPGGCSICNTTFLQNSSPFLQLHRRSVFLLRQEEKKINHGCAKEIDEQMTEMLQKTDENRIEK